MRADGVSGDLRQVRQDAEASWRKSRCSLIVLAKHCPGSSRSQADIAVFALELSWQPTGYCIGADHDN
jgi:hypothetical protein